MSLVTRCPKCYSDFVVKLEQLQALNGLVRCGACAHIFDGLASLESPLPTLTQRPSVAPASSSLTESPNVAPSFLSPNAEPAVLRTRAGRSEAPTRLYFSARSTDRTPGPSESILGESRLRGEGTSAGRTQPEFLIDEVDTPRLMMLLWSLASALALGLLVIQLAYVYRNDLATQFPTLRPALNSMCAKLGCEVSLRRHLERISVSVIALERHSATEQEGKAAVMSLRFSLRNRMNQAQPWPALSLELTDASGTVVLRKPMRPKDYLPAQLAEKPFAANQEISLTLPVTVAGLQINGYTLKPFFP
jgi:predicted Zn finger-like uncharacterized protein